MRLLFVTFQNDKTSELYLVIQASREQAKLVKFLMDGIDYRMYVSGLFTTQFNSFKWQDLDGQLASP